MVGQVGEPVARGALERALVGAHQRPAADEVEGDAAEHEGEQPEEDERLAHGADLGLELAVSEETSNA